MYLSSSAVSQSDECVERLQSCQFCELELPWKALDEHQHVCGSRTELCSNCGRYVTLRDQPEHGLTCSATDNVSGSPQTASKPPPNTSKGMQGSKASAQTPVNFGNITTPILLNCYHVCFPFHSKNKSELWQMYGIISCWGFSETWGTHFCTYYDTNLLKTKHKHSLHVNI